jgi:methylmalonyl-CoA/ethylmalonyl-CoA epimerase
MEEGGTAGGGMIPLRFPTRFGGGLANDRLTGQAWVMSGENEGSFQLDHVAFGVPEVAAAAPFLASELGGRPAASGPGVEFRWWQWQFARGGTLEVLEPDGPPGGFIHRFLKSRGPGVHHVTFKVPDLEAAAARAASLGYAVVGYNAASPSWKECFLHPKQAQGIVVQMAETGPELEPEDDIRYAFPEVAPAATEPADILGLRLNAHSETRARHQWKTLLGGTCEATEGDLLFRWPNSALKQNVVCRFGGIAGFNTCPDFSQKAKNEKIIWRK